jgi:hypothetical protein
MTGGQFETAAEEINGEASIGETLLYQLGNLGNGLIEQRRPWMVLRKTDTLKSVMNGNTWQSAIDLSTISDFNRFYQFYQTLEDPYPIIPYDGDNRGEKYRIVPFARRLDFKDVPHTAVHDAVNAWEESKILRGR